MLKKIKNRFFSESQPLEYRISMIFFIVAFFVSILSATTNTILGKGIMGIIFQWLFIAMMGVFFFLKPNTQLKLFRPLVLLTCLIYIPFLFTQTAGYDGTALMFSLLGLFIISVAFKGKLRFILIISNVLLLVALCILAYVFPEMIVGHDGAQAKFLDQIVALVVSCAGMAVLSIYIIGTLRKNNDYTTKVLSELQQKNKNLAEISQIFINLHHDDDSMRKSMDLAGSFLNCNHLVFWVRDSLNPNLVPKYYWSRNVLFSPENEEKRFVKDSVFFNELYVKRNRYVKYNDEKGSGLAVSLFIENEFWGLLEIANNSNYEWADNDIQLALLLTSVYASFLERRKYEDSIEKQLKQQSLTSTIFNSFINIDDLYSRVNDALELLGEYLNCSIIDIIQNKHKNLVVTHKWSKENGEVLLPFDYKEEMKNEKSGYFIDRLGNKKQILIIPYYLENKFAGVIRFLANSTDKWKENDIQLCRLFGATYSVVLGRQKQSEDLMIAKTAAESASLAKSNFLSNMSHEIRTPLNAIVGMTQIGLQSNNEEKYVECLNNINLSTKQLLNIVNDILDISKIESGKLELESKEFDIKDLIKEITTLMKKDIDKKDLKLNITYDNKIESNYLGDRIRVGQIITNLLSNAIKFTNENGKIGITISENKTADDKALIKVMVSDNGIGITEEQISRIFNSFEQADNSVNRRFGGTGLGLAIVKNLIEEMNGTITVESEPNKGSSFTFEIELGLVRKTKKTVQKEIKPAAKDYSNVTIILAEDIEINQIILTELLAKTGIKIVVASDGNIAYNLFKENPKKYDAIFMDVQMPVVDGLEATKMIRALDNKYAQNIPIIAMTANVFKEDIEKCLNAGMNDHLGKPVVIENVYAVLEKYVSKINKK